jgi:AraC family transcriptional regulator
MEAMNRSPEHSGRGRLIADRLDVPPGGGAFAAPRLAVGIFLVDQDSHRIAVGSDKKMLVPLHADQGWILPAGATGVCEYDEPLSYLKLEVADSLLDEVGFDRSSDFDPLVGAIDPLLIGFIRHAVANEHAPSSLYRDTMNLAMAAHLAHLLSPAHPFAVPVGDKRLRRALAYIHDNLGEDLSLDAIASEAAMSRFHFVRAFTRLRGKTPLQYVIHQRMELAKVLLRTTRLPVASVAANVGYDDASRFGQHFRRHTGTTPGAYRQH